MSNNKPENNIYMNQNESDLYALENKLREQGEVVALFTKEQWDNVSKIIASEMKEFKEDAARRYVATKLLKALEEKYPRVRQEYHGSKHLPIFETGDVETYEKKFSCIYNLYDVRDIISVEEIPVETIHLLVNGVEDPLLGKALLSLFDNKTSFSVNIYSTNRGNDTFLKPEEDKKTTGTK